MKKIFISIITVFIFLSCSKVDTLDTVKQTDLVEDLAFDTPARVLQQVLGMYSGVKSGNFYGGRYFVYNDIRGEEFLNQVQNQVTNTNTWAFSVSSTTNEVQNLWTAAYLAINRCNIVIDKVKTAPISDDLKKQYTAEALFLRALSHYSLVTLYAKPYIDGNGSNPGIILRLNPVYDGSQNNIKRSSVAEVYDQVIKDLNDAEQGLLSVNPNAYDNTTRAHKNTAIALKTRVYLSKGDYVNVIAEASKIAPQSTAPFSSTTGVNNRLMPSITSVFAPGAITNENIFSFVFSPLNVPGVQNGLASYYNPASTNNGTGEYSLNPDGILGNTTAWPESDARRKAFVITSAARPYLIKYPSNSATAPDYVPVIRYSEVLLNLAEAIVRNTSTADSRAISLLNAVHRRSDTSITFTDANFATSADLLNQIATERRIEFLGEGLRSIDIMRLNLSFPKKGVVPEVKNSDTQYIWPIPQSELLYNNLCKQNPGY
jgi:starch-binding outer membrane protein, SusD/RagB family